MRILKNIAVCSSYWISWLWADSCHFFLPLIHLVKLVESFYKCTQYRWVHCQFYLLNLQLYTAVYKQFYFVFWLFVSLPIWSVNTRLLYSENDAFWSWKISNVFFFFFYIVTGLQVLRGKFYHRVLLSFSLRIFRSSLFWFWSFGENECLCECRTFFNLILRKMKYTHVT